MKKVFKAVIVLSLAAFVAAGISGCRKKTVKKDLGVPGEIEMVDVNGPFAPDPNKEIYGKWIYFDFDRSEIKPEAKPILEAIALDLKANPKKYLRAEGHCDERGTNEYNLALGERRAQSTREYLVSLGVNGNRIATISFGEEKPANPGHDEAAWAENRRSEFTTYEEKK